VILSSPRSLGKGAKDNIKRCTQRPNRLSMLICGSSADPSSDPFLEWFRGFLGYRLFVTYLSISLPRTVSKSGHYATHTRPATDTMGNTFSKAVMAPSKSLESSTLTSFVRLAPCSLLSYNYFSLKKNLLLIKSKSHLTRISRTRCTLRNSC